MKRETATTKPGAVRIIGGALKRSKLEVLDRPGLRPTPSRVRETLFNWLMPAIAEANIVDCFSGTGALGLEALSRGARHTTFIESDPLVCQTLKHNITRFGLTDRAVVVCGDVLSQQSDLVKQANIIFADPPFHHGISQAFLAWIHPELQPDCRLIIECERTETLDMTGFEVLKTLHAGMDSVYLLRATP